ncbi:hypothetical protein Lal_00027212 [Lupinus albus]|nr:hypothetical protein Lal_00027212 [Lupinus albus]
MEANVNCLVMYALGGRLSNLNGLDDRKLRKKKEEGDFESKNSWKSSRSLREVVAVAPRMSADGSVFLNIDIDFNSRLKSCFWNSETPE